MESIQVLLTGDDIGGAGTGRDQGDAEARIVRVPRAPISLGRDATGLLMMTGYRDEPFLAGQGIIQIHGAAAGK